MAEPFALFNHDHIWALIIVLVVAIGPSLILRKFKNPSLNRRFEIGLGITLIVYGIFKHLYGPLGLGEAWQIWLPLHMCQISNFVIAYCLLSGKRGRVIDVIYFWTFAGASMAMATPDISFGWPDPNYILFMITHGLLLLGALYFPLVDGYRPTGQAIWPVLKITLVVTAVIFPLNYLIGGDANYFYLRFPPVVGSIMDLLPQPPLHIPFMIVLAYMFFWVVYLPYLIRDLIFSSASVETG